MNFCRYVIPSFLMCVLLAAAGCTTGTGPSAPAAPAAPAPVAPATSAALAPLALTPADLPDGYTLTESREKTAADVSALALSLGWQDGYTVTYTNTSAVPAERTTIVQTVTVYPAKSVPDIISAIGRQERSDGNMSFTDIPSFGIGDLSGGYTGKARAPMVLTTDKSNPLAPKATITESNPDVAEVWVAKGTVFEVIRMTGPGADAATVTALARTAYAKMP